jgi:signal peptidase II
VSVGRRKYLLFWVAAALSFILDQGTKILVRKDLRPLGPFNPKVIVAGYFDLRYAENPDGAFRMFQDMSSARMILTGLAVAAFVLVLYQLRKTLVRSPRRYVALGLVGGGAIGNLVDRVLYGKVTDFIIWKVGAHEWPAFNVADAALCVGVALTVLDLFLTRPAPGAPA